MNDVLSFGSMVLNSSTSILFGALGILLMQLAGVMNIGAEGMMLIGAFAGYIGSIMTGSAWLGGIFAAVVTGIVGILYAFCTIQMKANQVVVGIALNIFASGLTTTFCRVIFGMGSSSVKADSFAQAGPFSIPVYGGIALVALLTFLLYKTKVGLKVRGVGENPVAIDSMGLHVNRIRYISVIVGSMIIGFGGAFLSLGELSFFTEDMVSGRGYIALAAVIFGRYTPVGTWLAVLVFGAGEALVYKFQAMSVGVPTQVILMIPYVLTILVVTIFGQKGSGPKALGIPFVKGEK